MVFMKRYINTSNRRAALVKKFVTFKIFINRKFILFINKIIKIIYLIILNANL